MGRPKKQLKDLNQTDGKASPSLAAQAAREGEEIIPNVQLRGKYRSLDEAYGFSNCLYKTHDEAAYAADVRAMNKADLYKECSRVGLLPNDNRTIMEERLVKKFQQETANVLSARSVQAVVLKPSKR